MDWMGSTENGLANRRRFGFAILFAFCLSLCLSACGEYLFGEEITEVPATQELVDGRVYAAPDSYILGRRIAERTEVRLAFEGSRLTASAGCRSATGDFTVRKSRLRAPDLEVTGERCSKTLSDQENWLFDFLRGPIHASLASKDAHVLYIGNKKVSLEMGALEPSEPDQGRLRSEGWFLRRTNDVSVAGLSEYNKRMPDANSIPTLSMHGEDKFIYSSDCGSVGGRFSFDDTTIEFDRKNESRHRCDQDARDLHAAVAPLFDGSFDYRFDGPDLVISKDGTSLRFFSG